MKIERFMVGVASPIYWAHHRAMHSKTQLIVEAAAK